jgi:PadR family transcriptional regulator PadR
VVIVLGSLETAARLLASMTNLPPGQIHVDYQHVCVYVDSQRMDSDQPADEVPYGTLDLMVLKTLQVMGALHGYAIARRIEQVARGSLALNQGTIYPALLRLEQKGWIASKWGVSETKRRVRFFTITRAGLRQLAVEQRAWARTVAMLNRLLEES